jgi:hypothetical protein
MGFLKDTANRRGPDEEDEAKDPKTLEETYQRLYMKTGRDFVSREDFVSIIEQILDVIDPEGIENIDPWENGATMSKAADYRDLIRQGRSASMQHLDLIDLSED